MKLKTYIEEANYFSGKASDINRNLVFAGIAIIWIFKNSKEGAIDLPDGLYLPLILFILSLVIDLVQYVSGYLLWSLYVNNLENKGKKEEDEVSELEWQSVLIDIFWGMKLVSNIAAFIFLMRFLLNNMT